MSDFVELFRSRSHGLVLPQDDDDEVNRYVAMHSGERESVERRPFRRQVDFWAFSIATALALKLEPREGTSGAGERVSSTLIRGFWTTTFARCSL